MQVVDKFVINRNNIKYIYVEHLLGNFNYSSYHVYNNSSLYECLSPNDFYLIYGNDERLTIFSYIKEAETNIVSYGDNDSLSYLKEFKAIKPLISYMNENNPSLRGCKSTLLSSIDYYNNYIANKVYFYEHDYEEDLKILNELNNEENIRILSN